MICPRCQSTNVSVQVVNETTIKQKKHGCIWWILIGWWLEAILWLFLTLPRLIFAIFRRKKYKVDTVQKTVYVCQSCGHSWQ